MHSGKLLRLHQWRTPKTHALRFRHGDALRLTLADVGTLILRNKGKHLQHNVAEERSHQVFASPGIQQRHIQHHDVDALFLCEHPPLLQNFRVVAAQTVNALDIEQIVFFHFPKQLLILRTVKIFAGLLVDEQVCLRNRHFPESDQLAILVLFSGAHPDVAVNHNAYLLEVKKGPVCTINTDWLLCKEVLYFKIRAQRSRTPYGSLP